MSFRKLRKICVAYLMSKLRKILRSYYKMVQRIAVLDKLERRGRARFNKLVEFIEQINVFSYMVLFDIVLRIRAHYGNSDYLHFVLKYIRNRIISSKVNLYYVRHQGLIVLYIFFIQLYVYILVEYTIIFYTFLATLGRSLTCRNMFLYLGITYFLFDTYVSGIYRVYQELSKYVTFSYIIITIEYYVMITITSNRFLPLLMVTFYLLYFLLRK